MRMAQSKSVDCVTGLLNDINILDMMHSFSSLYVSLLGTRCWKLRSAPVHMAMARTAL